MLKNKTLRVYIVLINARHVSQSKLSRLDQVSSLLESRLKGFIIPMNPIISSLRQQSVYMGMCVCACLFGLRLKGGGQHLWEQFEEDGKKELHEGDDDKHHEGHQTEEVSTGPHQLQQTETVQGVRQQYLCCGAADCGSFHSRGRRGTAMDEGSYKSTDQSLQFNCQGCTNMIFV